MKKNCTVTHFTSLCSKTNRISGGACPNVFVVGGRGKEKINANDPSEKRLRKIVRPCGVYLCVQYAIAGDRPRVLNYNIRVREKLKKKLK